MIKSFLEPINLKEPLKESLKEHYEKELQSFIGELTTQSSLDRLNTLEAEFNTNLVKEGIQDLIDSGISNPLANQIRYDVFKIRNTFREYKYRITLVLSNELSNGLMETHNDNLAEKMYNKWTNKGELNGRDNSAKTGI